MSQTIETIRFTINADGIRSMEGIADLDATVDAYRDQLQVALSARYPGADVEVDSSPVHVRGETMIEVDGDTGHAERDAIRTLSDDVLMRVLEA